MEAALIILLQFNWNDIYYLIFSHNKHLMIKIWGWSVPGSNKLKGANDEIKTPHFDFCLISQNSNTKLTFHFFFILKTDIHMHILARAVGIPVGRRLGGWLALTLVATKNIFIFFFPLPHPQKLFRYF